MSCVYNPAYHIFPCQFASNIYFRFMLSQESNNDHNEFSEPQTLAAVVDLSDLSCNAVTTLKTNSTVAPQKSETFEPSGSLESREEPLQLEKQQNLLINLID